MGAVSSVLHQSRPAEQVILIDDASVDGTSEVLIRAARQWPAFETRLHTTNLGPARTFNEGVFLCKHDFVVILNGDDYLPVNYLSEMSQALEYNSWSFAYSDVRCIGNVEGYIRYPEFSRDALGNQNVVHGSAMFRRSEFLALGGFSRLFDPLGFEDWDLWARFVAAGLTGGKCSTTHLTWRRHSGGSRNSLTDVQYILARYLLWLRSPSVVRRLQLPTYFLYMLKRGVHRRLKAIRTKRSSVPT